MASQLFGLPCTSARVGMRARPSWSAPDESPTLTLLASTNVIASPNSAVRHVSGLSGSGEILLQTSSGRDRIANHHEHNQR